MEGGEQGIRVKLGPFPFSALGRARKCGVKEIVDLRRQRAESKGHRVRTKVSVFRFQVSAFVFLLPDT